jgi:hypothetical protein
VSSGATRLPMVVGSNQASAINCPYPMNKFLAPCNHPNFRKFFSCSEIPLLHNFRVAPNPNDWRVLTFYEGTVAARMRS